MSTDIQHSVSVVSGVADPQSCDSVQNGYQCEPAISHVWGQYSPYFTIPSTIDTTLPPTCEVTFAQILSRHGARDPTAQKTAQYNATIQQIQANVSSFHDQYAFLSNFDYTLGADQLTVFGQQEMINSGMKFFHQYSTLAQSTTPFVRSSGEARVVESAQNWTQGYHDALINHAPNQTDKSYPYQITVISEDDGSNNTLSHGLCTAFENGPASTIQGASQQTWANIFVPSITGRLNSDLHGADLSQVQTIDIMDMCPFVTVASPNGSISDFCNLFTEAEWHQYSYYETLGKYYGTGAGNPLGPTQGVGFVNELIARLTDKPVVDHTSTNRTLDSNPATFPLGRALYADFSHDNDITGIIFALGLYNGLRPLSNSSVTEVESAKGYSAAWTVPFAARLVVEKWDCGLGEEMVRILVNDRVQPLAECGGDALGRCGLGAFVESLSFARAGGHWDQCFV